MEGCAWRKQKLFRDGVKVFQKVKVFGRIAPLSVHEGVLAQGIRVSLFALVFSVAPNRQMGRKREGPREL
jgi:hypothetical protein